MRKKKAPLLHPAPSPLAQAAIRHHRQAARLAAVLEAGSPSPRHQQG